MEVELSVGSEGWSLPATLTLPKEDGPFPAVVLVHGSGPHDRDETIGPNKPFKDLAWGLATRGIAVLRYEKRTKQYPFKIAGMIENITVDGETVDDALAGIESLHGEEKIDRERIFVLGHSFGGMLAPRIGARAKKLAGLILLAGNTRNLPDMILDQVQYLASLDGKIDETEARQIKDTEELVRKVKELDMAENEIVLGGSKVYWESLSEYDPVKVAKELSLPMLILQGERDYQVTLENDLKGWKNGLADKEEVEFKTYPDLNHLFMSGFGRSTPAEYQKASNVARIVIEDITKWVKKQ